MLEDPYIINKTTTENAPPKAEKRDGSMCESGASFLSLYHNTEVCPHRKNAADSNDDIPQFLFYALCTGFLNTYYLALEHKINVQ
jgi:hypothetical protein